MKKNVMMRVASALLVAVLMTTCAISGTFAKYTTTQTGSDSAHVAKWGVTVEVTGTSAFLNNYESGDVVSSVTEEKVVAPGTDGTLATAEISGTPEVRVNVKREATLELTGWTVDGDFYCPIVITVGSSIVSGLDYDNAADFIDAVEAFLDYDQDIEANQDLEYEVVVTWKWAFNGDDAKDTKLGDAAAAGSPSTIKFTYEIAVNQLGD